MNKIRQIMLQLLMLSLTGLGIVGCDNAEQITYRPTFGEAPPISSHNSYVIGVHPLHNPQRLLDVFGPLADLLSKEIIGATFTIEASRNYASYDKKLYAGKFEFALPNPYQTILSLRHGYKVFGKMSDDHNFRGIILVQKNSKIDKVTDLKGKAVSFPAPTALAATMMPQCYLHQNGLDVNNDIKINYVGSQESSIMNVFLGNVAAGATWIPPWEALSKEKPELAEKLEIKWQTEPLPNNGFVVRNDVSEEIVEQVANILFKLHTTQEGKEILSRMELSQFSPATNKTYDTVLEFLETFNNEVRPITIR